MDVEAAGGGDDENDDSFDGSTGEKSTGYFINKEDPTVVAMELNTSGARFIDDRGPGTLRFKSSRWERDFLAEARSSLL